MAMNPVLTIELFRRIGKDGDVPQWERQRSQESLTMFLEALKFTSKRQLQLQRKMAGKALPPLYMSGIYYQREPDGREWWQDALTNFKLGEGDCEDLATHRAAELVVYFKRPAKPFVTFRRDEEGRYHYHVIVMCQDDRGKWRLEDPSRKLGMGWEEQFQRTPLKERLRIGVEMDKIQAKISPGKLAKLKNVFGDLDEMPGLKADFGPDTRSKEVA
jgi:hypothetical protein